jgi:hypothetical protein
MTNNSDDFKELINKKLLGVSDNGDLFFEGGIMVDTNPYETYVHSYDKETVSKADLKYYSPKLLKGGN